MSFDIALSPILIAEEQDPSFRVDRADRESMRRAHQNSALVESIQQIYGQTFFHPFGGGECRFVMAGGCELTRQVRCAFHSWKRLAGPNTVRMYLQAPGDSTEQAMAASGRGDRYVVC